MPASIVPNHVSFYCGFAVAAVRDVKGKVASIVLCKSGPYGPAFRKVPILEIEIAGAAWTRDDVGMFAVAAVRAMGGDAGDPAAVKAVADACLLLAGALS